jgi:asparagine synthase (glutamine-hydrolysing)
VYNYIELRGELEGRGYRFRSHTDTEVILAAYAEWGPDCLGRFNGMWAFAIWDALERVFFCARDRFGVKPLYYHWNGKHFAFASEIKALLAHPEVPRTLNNQAILDYLLSGSADHLPGQTFFAEIRQLLPAHYLIVKDGSLQMRCYWDIQIPPQKQPVTDALVTQCRDLLRNAARLRLRSDAAVGGTLSGGLDSSILACLIDQELISNTYHVFSAQFPGHPLDEGSYVDDVIAQAQHLRLHAITPSYQELIDDLPKLIWHQDEPFGDTSIYAHYRLMQLARQNGIKVILTGQGADEIFGGYWSYYRAFLGNLLIARRIRSLRQEIRDRAKITGEAPLALLKAAVYHALPPRLRTQIQSFVLCRQADWISSEFRRFGARHRFDPAPDGWSQFDWYLYESLRKWSIPHLLRHDDRNSMAFGVESRVPYLDYRLVQLLFSSTDDAKIAHGRTKVLLRCAGEDMIPASIAARNDKIGFYTPMAEWLDNARDFIGDMLSTDFARQNPYFSAQRLSCMLQGLSVGKCRSISPLWWGLSLCLWHEVMVKEKGAPAGVKLANAHLRGFSVG